MFLNECVLQYDLLIFIYCVATKMGTDWEGLHCVP